MRILYLCQYFITLDAPGGTRLYETARRLIAAGHEVRLITSSAMLPPPLRDIQQIARTDVSGITTIIIPLKYDNKMSFWQRIQAFIRFFILASWEAMRIPADVVFATSTPLTIAIPGIAARGWQRIPMVFEVRDLWPELPIAIGALNNSLLRWMAYALEWLAYHMSKHVVVLSPGMVGGVVRQGISADRITVIPNGCDVMLFDIPPVSPNPVRQKLGIQDHQPLIVYAGTFGHINGVGYLVDVAAEMRSIFPDVHFLLLGDGAERDSVIEHARDIGLLDQTVSVWSPLPKAQMPLVMAAATVATSIFIPLPEMRNNSANKFFDALAAGRPIAINYEGWQADILRQSGGGIVIPAEDPANAARHLAEFLRSPERLQTAGAAARQLSYTEFNRDHLAEKLMSVLENVVGVKS